MKPKMKDWKGIKQTFPFGDQNVTISFYGRTTYDLANIQVSFEHGEMTKRELFKRLLFRLWHRI